MTTVDTHPISLVVFDMAGTTVEDSGLVQQSFAAADEHAGLSRDSEDKARMLTYVTDTMGQSKIDVFDTSVAETKNKPSPPTRRSNVATVNSSATDTAVPSPVQRSF